MILSDDQETVEQMLHVHRLIQQKIGASATKRSLQPLWYRGLSDSQMAAADSLHLALADDILEGSTYRVYYVLHRLGVTPRPPKSGLRQLFPMSRGNDVAFLWFLMEAYYTSDIHNKLYGCNEQIIMSTIFWLDLFPTLRELDRVLPLPHASEEDRMKEAHAKALRKKQQKREKLKQIRKQRQAHEKTNKPQSAFARLPYFEKPLQRKFQRRNLLAAEPKRPANLPIVPPESANSTLSSRWFGAFDFADGQRIATSVLQKEIDNIMSCLQAAKLKKRHVRSMCMHHRQINEMELSLRHNLEKIKEQKRKLLIDVDARTKERNRRRTLDQLDRMTEHYLQQFHEMAVKTRMSSTRKQLCAEALDSDFVYLGQDDCQFMDDNSGDWLGGVKILEGNEPLKATRWNTIPRRKSSCKFDKRQSLGQRPSTLRRFLQLRRVDEHNQNVCSSSECTKYFNISDNNFSFNYRKLFAPNKSKLLDNEQMRLRAEFIKALDEDVEYLNAVLHGDECGSLDSLVDRSTKRMFREGTELFQQEYAKMAEEESRKEPETQTDQRLDFGQQYYDANNIELMTEMLKLGLARVAEDRRYILPTLPHVHSVPLLIKWICARYGKRYSSEERKRDFTDAHVLMKQLMVILNKEIVRRHCRRPVTLPSKVLNIRDQNKMSRLLSMYWTQFMKYFVLSMMELGRIFHSTMQADQGSQATSTYYAYMPAHIQDIEFSRTTPFFDRRKRTKL